MNIALWQTTPRQDISDALDALAATSAEAAANGADLLVTPEMFVGGYNIGATEVRHHAARTEEVLSALSNIARTQGIALIAGLASPCSPKPANSCVVINATGSTLARYQKTHLYGDVDRTQFSAGSSLSQIFQMNGWSIGLAICYDIEFPEVARSLALKGAEIIITPTANMAPFESVATRLVPARAEENGIYVAYCNYVGREGAFAYNGLTCLCGPSGNDLVRAEGQSEALLYAGLDRTTLDAARRVQTHLHDRRSDLY